MLSNVEINNVVNELKKTYRKKNSETKYPFLNVYEWKGELICSTPYQTEQDAFVNADQSFYVDFKPEWMKPRRIANAKENEVRYLGCFNLIQGVLNLRTPKEI